MKTLRLSLTLALAVASCTSSGDQSTTTPASALTNRYDNTRSGWNPNETVLNTTTVASGKFGMLFSRSLQGWIHAQPLYYPGVSVDGTNRNVVYLVTEKNMVYAFDADDPGASAPLWSKGMGDTFPLSAAPMTYPGCQDILVEAGISSTPVISPDTKKLYVVSKTSGSGGQLLHALDLATGAEAAGSPATISAMGFDPTLHLARTGLLLDKGIVYISFASQCDSGDYHGWVMGYDAATLKQVSVLNTTPNAPAAGVKAQGGIWQSGAGLAADDKGILMVVGNGDSSGNNLGMSVVRLKRATEGLAPLARFTPADAVMLNEHDKDLSTAALVLGSSGQIVAGNKVGDIYLLKQDDLSLLQKQTIISIPPPAEGKTNSDEIHSFGYWNGSAGPMVYTWPDKSPLKAFKVETGKLTDVATNTIMAGGAHPGGLFVITSDGAKAGTGLLWAIVPMMGDAWHDAAQAQLFAFDATDVSKPPLWSSPDKPEGDHAADHAGILGKWAPPVVVNGKVYIATGGVDSKLLVYGLKN
jgi:hypothetical protein